MENGLSGRNPNFWGQKKHTLLNGNHVPATTGQSCTKEKVPFSQINISLLGDFGCFFGEKKNGFLPVVCFSAKRKNGLFSVIPAGTWSVVNVGHFLGGPDGPTKFRCSRTKIKSNFP